jgi:hypothetical protein
MGSHSSVGMATRYGLDGPGIESRCGRVFRTRPDQSWDSRSLLYSFFAGAKGAGRGVNHPPPSSVEVKEREELYLYSAVGIHDLLHG